jgi:D-alanine-D-alanine ligase
MARLGLHAGRRCVVLHNNDYLAADRQASEELIRSLDADAEVAQTAEAVRAALSERGWLVNIVTVSESVEALGALLAPFAPEVVFNLVESLGGDSTREREAPAALERLGIPFTGAGSKALEIAYAKDAVRSCLQAAGVRIAAGSVLMPDEALEELPRDYPLFVKPAHTHASIGIDQASIVHDHAALATRVAWLRQTIGGPILLEAYLPGDEINVAVLPARDRAITIPTRIDFSGYPEGYAPIVTYDCKWNEASPEYAAVSRPVAHLLAPALLAELDHQARAALAAIGSTSYARVDMRLGSDGLPRVIDLNPNCDLHPEAGMAIAAASAGFSYADLIETIALAAMGAGT